MGRENQLLIGAARSSMWRHSTRIGGASSKRSQTAICAFPFTGNVGAARVDGGELTISVAPVAHATVGGRRSLRQFPGLRSPDRGFPARWVNSCLTRLDGRAISQSNMRYPSKDRSTLQARGTFEYHGSNLRRSHMGRAGDLFE